jgi:1-phosphatidylinositol-3-phosphate 5-kinase
VVDRAELLFSEVLNALCLIEEKRSGAGPLNNGMKNPETRRRIADLEGLLQKEKAEFEVRPFLCRSNFAALIYN